MPYPGKDALIKQKQSQTKHQQQQQTRKSQFHFFYGSTKETATMMNPSTNDRIVPAAGSNNSLSEDGENNQNEHDSLVGEELVSTDNEGEQELQSLVNNGRKRKPKISKNLKTAASSLTSSFGIGSIVIFLVIAGAGAFLAVLLIPHNSDPLPETQTFSIPFPLVDRSDYGDPVEDILNMDLFHPNLIAPPGSSQAFVFPFPTGAFWTNLVVHSPIGDVSYPIAVYPYAYRWTPSSIQVSYPAGHRVSDEHVIQDTFAPDLTITSVENISKRLVTEFDPLSVTLRFVSSADSKWETALVQGSPYVTIQCLKSTPLFQPLSIFSTVQCPGDADENFSDLDDDFSDESNKQEFDHRQLFGVCSMEVRLSKWNLSSI
jgi:endoglucanase Acf2